jgi:hypothetical protein
VTSPSLLTVLKQYLAHSVQYSLSSGQTLLLVTFEKTQPEPEAKFSGGSPQNHPTATTYEIDLKLKNGLY